MFLLGHWHQVLRGLWLPASLRLFARSLTHSLTHTHSPHSPHTHLIHLTHLTLTSHTHLTHSPHTHTPHTSPHTLTSHTHLTHSPHTHTSHITSHTHLTHSPHTHTPHTSPHTLTSLTPSPCSVVSSDYLNTFDFLDKLQANLDIKQAQSPLKTKNRL